MNRTLEVVMKLKLGRKILGGSVLVYVHKDREGYYFTFDTGGKGQKIRLTNKKGNWKYRLPGKTTLITAVFAAPPRKPHS